MTEENNKNNNAITDNSDEEKLTPKEAFLSLVAVAEIVFQIFNLVLMYIKTHNLWYVFLQLIIVQVVNTQIILPREYGKDLLEFTDADYAPAIYGTCISWILVHAIVFVLIQNLF